MNRKHCRLLIQLLTTCILTGMIVVSCKKMDASGYQASLIAGNWVVNGSAFKVQVDDQKLNNDSLTYQQLSSTSAAAYTQVGAGIHRITISSGTNTLINDNFPFTAGKQYTLILYDTLKNNKLKVLLLQDKINTVDTLVTARFFQMIPTTDSVRILLKKDTLGYYTSSVYLGEIASTITGSFPLALPPGSYEISLSRKNTVISQPVPITLTAGKAYTFFSKGVVGGTGIYSEGLQVLQHN